MNPLSNIRIVLVRPIYGGNVGAVCRAMKNMGVSDLWLVKPNPEMDLMEARKFALHAADVFENRRVAESVFDAVQDCAVVAATTGLKGLYRSHAKSPREHAARLLETAFHHKVALVFGPEHHGLSNEEMRLATILITIPSSTAYPSLNLAQAVLICCYELFLASGVYAPPREYHPEAPIEMRERFLELWREMLLAIRFCDEGKLDHMMFAFRRIFGRGYLSEADVNILMGVARQAMWAARHGPRQRGCPSAEKSSPAAAESASSAAEPASPAEP